MLRNLIVKPILFDKSPKKVHYGVVETPKYGQLFLAYYFEKNLHICYSHFTKQSNEKCTKDLHVLWPNVELIHDDKSTKEILKTYMTKQKEITVVLSGTDFQMKVWSALLEIPFGEELTYGDVAVSIGNPKAVRAVASAVASNNIAIFIPCHRVKGKTGDLHKYRWGANLKKIILLDEQDKQLFVT